MDSLWRRAQRLATDNTIGPQHGDKFDFTLEFEESVFTIAPAAGLVLVTPFWVAYYRKKPIFAPAEPLLWIKLASALALIVLEAVGPALTISPDDAAKTATAASALSCISGLALAIFLYFEHRHAVVSSFIPGLYLFVTILLDCAKARSYFLRKDLGMYTMAYLTAAVAALKFVLLILEEIPKRHRLPKEELGPDTVSGFWSRTFLIWMNSTIFLGFSNILSVDDLPNLDRSFSSAHLAAVFESFWSKDDKSSFKLIKTTLRTVLWSFLAVVPSRTLFIGFNFADPFLLRTILQQLNDGSGVSDINKGLIGAIALVRLGISITRVWHRQLNDRLATKVRGALTSQILRKSLLLNDSTAKKSSAVSLMSTDVNGIVTGLFLVHELWAGILEIAIGLYLLSTVVQKSVVFAAIPTIVGALVSMEVARRSSPAYRDWNQQIELRVAETSKFLAQFTGIKMIGAERAVGDYIQRLRETEMHHSKKPRLLSMLSMICVVLSYTVTPVLVFAGALYWDGFDNFNATEAFTTLAFVFLVADPLSSTIKAWTKFGELAACFNRIQAYLLLEERVDSRTYRLPSNEDMPTEAEKRALQDAEKFPVQLADASVVSPTGTSLFTADTLFERSTITMVIGQTGAGKSVLLKTLLGDIEAPEGFVFVSPQQVAYCDQTVWLRNEPIRSNIIGELPYDEGRYKQAVSACMLSDLDSLPNGDLSLAGSRGSKLSGGQKQRIALARAMYSHAEVMLLDDVTSAVDRPTISEMASRLLGADGLVRSLGSTVIMTTHTVELLKYADNVLVIHTNGSVTVEAPEVAISKYGREDFFEEAQNTVEVTKTAEKSSYGTDEPDDDISRRKGDFTLYHYYSKSVRTSLFLVWLAAVVAFVAFEKIPDIYVRLWVQIAPEKKSWILGYALLGFGSMLSVLPCFGIFYGYLIPSSGEYLHRKLVDTIQDATLSFLTVTDSGSLLNRFSQDMSLVVQDLPSGILFTLYSGLGVISNVGAIAASTRFVALIIPGLLILLYILQIYYLRTSRQMRLLDLETKTPLFSQLTESSEGLQHIRAFKWEQQCLDKSYKALDNSQKPYYYLRCIQRWLNLVLDLAVAGIAVLLVILAFSFSSTSQAALGLGLFLIMRIAEDMAYLVMTWTALETALGALSRVRTFELGTPREQSESACEKTTIPESWPSRGDISLTDVNAEYSTPSGNHKVLHDLSLEISGGSKVGLVGRTGSGKSSLVLTLLNFLNYAGSITIDGIEISSIPRQELRSRITTISQNLVELPCSVRDNLTPLELNVMDSKQRTPDETLLRALQRVGLKEEIEKRGGLDTMLSEVGLSAGEKQLFALARALLHNAKTGSKIVFVDEATSNIDYESEKKMLEIMEEAFAECTVLTIAHRPETIRSLPKVLRMSGGRLVDEETEE